MSAITPPVSRAEPVDEPDDDLGLSANDLLDRLWHFFISMRTGLVLILVLAALSLIGTLLVQASPGLSDEPQAYAAWLDSLRAKYGGWTNVFEALGLFSIFSSVWFKVTMALLVTSVVACAANRTPILWKQATRPRLAKSEMFFERAPLNAAIATDIEDERTLVKVQAAFRSHHFRTVVAREDGEIHVFGDRFRWAPFGSVIAHVSLVVVLVGVLVGSTLGFRDTGFAAPIGTRVEVGYGTGLALEATSFTDTYSTENGAPSDYASELVVYRGSERVAAQRIHVNDPLRVGDVTFYQSFFGPAAAMRVTNARGEAIFADGVPLLWSSKDETERVGQFSLPDQSLEVFVVSAASGKVSKAIRPGQVQVELYRSGTTTPLDIKVIDQGKPATVGGLGVTFEREHQFTGLIVARDPGIPLVWGGALLLVFGVCLSFFFPNRRAWAVIRRQEAGGSDVRVGAIVRHDVTFERDFRAFVDGLKLSLDGRAAS